MFTSSWELATVLPWTSHLLHYLVTQVFLRHLQYGILVLGIVDVFVYAHRQHRQSFYFFWVIHILKPPGSQRLWKVNRNGAFFHPAEIPWSTIHRSKLSSRNVASFWTLLIGATGDPINMRMNHAFP